MTTRSSSTAPGSGERRLTIGLINDTPLDPNSGSIWAGVNEVALEHDATLVCYPASPLRSPRGFDAQANVLYDLAGPPLLDGMVVWTGAIRMFCSLEETRDFFDRYDGLPIVSIACQIGDAPTVMNSNQGMTDLVTHLVEAHGFRRIALIRGPEAHPETALRYRGYCDALSQAGIEVDPELIAPGDFQKESARTAVRLLLDERGVRPEAIVAMNDIMALGAMEELNDRGVHVPGDVAVVGFDNIDEAQETLPPLTTVQQDFRAQGRTAATELFKLLAGGDVMPTRVLPAPLVVRQSCSCLDAVVVDAGAPTPRSGKAGDLAAFVARTDEVAGKMAAAADDAPVFLDLARRTLEAFHRALDGGAAEDFLRAFSDILRQTIRAGQRVALWHAAVSAMRRCALSGLEDEPSRERAGDLVQQARVLVSDLALQASRKRILDAEEKSNLLSEISQSMLSVFEREELLGLIARELPRLGIRVCFLSIYDDPTAPTDRARLILAYDETGRRPLDPEGVPFPSRRLVPEGLLPADRRHQLIVEPLYFRDEQIGFAVLDADPMDGVIYDTLRATLSSALEGERLVRGLDRRTKELTAAYTDLKENQQKLLVTEKMASLGRLTAGIAHEMNTPLAAVRAALHEMGQLVDEYRESVGHPDVEPDDHRAIADDMARNLEIARGAAAKSAGFIRGIKAQTIDMKSNPHQAFPAAPVLRDTLNLLEFVLRKGQCTLETDIDESIQLFGDPRGLSQILTNLITNAVEACAPDGGTITVSFQEHDDGAELRVHDTGCGIPPDVAPRVFDPMFTTKPFGEGTGLGLAILHDFVQEFEGAVRVESQPGDTTFFIALPVEPRTP